VAPQPAMPLPEIPTEASIACFVRLPSSTVAVEEAAPQRDAGKNESAGSGAPQLNIGAVSDQNICFGPSTRTFWYPSSRRRVASSSARLPVLQYVTSGALRSAGNTSV